MKIRQWRWGTARWVSNLSKRTSSFQQSTWATCPSKSCFEPGSSLSITHITSYHIPLPCFTISETCAYHVYQCPPMTSRRCGQLESDPQPLGDLLGLERFTEFRFLRGRLDHLCLSKSNMAGRRQMSWKYVEIMESYISPIKNTSS